MSIVLTVGTFDTPHSGHVRFLYQCRKLANLAPLYSFDRFFPPQAKLIVAVNTDEFVRKFKGSVPLYPFKERKAVIGGLEGVTEVIENYSGEDLKPLISDIKPDFLAVGSDWAKKDYYTQTKLSQQWLDDMNVTLVYFPYTEGISSTELRGRISGS